MNLLVIKPVYVYLGMNTLILIFQSMIKIMITFCDEEDIDPVPPDWSSSRLPGGPDIYKVLDALAEMYKVPDTDMAGTCDLPDIPVDTCDLSEVSQ